MKDGVELGKQEKHEGKADQEKVDLRRSTGEGGSLSCPDPGA
jgi:hypothetical protein